MKELELKYGCNPNQKPSRIYMENGELPIQVLNGKPGYINFLDAFNGWQLVSELKKATGLPAATSFKHVSPAGAAVGLPLSDVERKIYWVDDMDMEFTPLANAYARARGADRMSSFGDFISLSDVCDKATAMIIKREVSDGVIAPGYTDEALEILKAKKKGNYNVIQIDPNYVPAPIEHKEVFGITFEQGRNELNIDDKFFDNIVTEYKELTEDTEGVYRGIGVTMQKDVSTGAVIVVKCFEGAPGAEAGLQPQDQLVKVNGEDITDKELSEVVKMIKTSESDTVTLTILREGESDYREVEVTLDTVEAPMVEHELLDNNFGYITINQFAETTASQYETALEDLNNQGMERLIVDVRDNPGGLLTSVCDVLDSMLPEELLVYTED